MAVDLFETCATQILKYKKRKQTAKLEDMKKKLNTYYRAGRITEEQYAELMEMCTV